MRLLFSFSDETRKKRGYLFEQHSLKLLDLHIATVIICIFTVYLAYFNIPAPSEIQFDSNYKSWYVTPMRQGDGLGWIKGLCEQNKGPFCRFHHWG